MLLRGRPRTLGAAALLLLLLIGFFLFGGDPDCELGGAREARRGGGGGGDPRSVPGSPTPRVPPDGRPRSQGAATFDGDPPADPRGHNRSDCIPPPPLPPKCEVGRCARPLAAGIPGSPPRPAPLSPGTWTPVGIPTPAVGSDTDRPAGGAPGSHLPFSWPWPPCLGNEGVYPGSVEPPRHTPA